MIFGNVPVKSKTYIANSGTVALDAELGAKACIVAVICSSAVATTANVAIYQNGLGLTSPLLNLLSPANESRVYVCGAVIAGNTRVAVAGAVGGLPMPFPCGILPDNIAGALPPVVVVTVGAASTATIFYVDDIG